jgi:hypothetical protein
VAVPILWRSRRQRYSLEGEKCPACERAVFPPRQVCPYCSRERAESARQAIVHQAHIGTENGRMGNGQVISEDTLDSILSLPELQLWISDNMKQPVREAGDD